MHILFVADGDSKYGAQNSLYQLVQSLKEQYEDIEISVVLTKQSDKVEDFKKINCHVYQVSFTPYQQGIPVAKWKYPIKYVIKGISYWYGRLFAVRELEKKMDMHEIDLIHSNSSREDLGAALAKKYALPLVWHIREFGDLDYAVYSYRKDYIKLMNETATKLIAVSEAVRKHWMDKGIDRNRIIAIYDGVYENALIKKEYPKTEDDLHFIMMGSLCETKGQHQIIDAISLLSEKEKERVYLDIAGDGSSEYTRTLERLVASKHLTGRVRFLGYRKNFYKQLSQYDCGLMCSTSEGFGRVTVEYMMAGLPVIASDTGANPELVEDGVNGLLYRYGDSNDLAGKLSYLLKSTQVIEKLGKCAYETAAGKYTAHINAVKIYEEYEKIWKK